MPSRSPSSRRRRAVRRKLHNASIGIVDEDHSELSRRIAHAFLPPYFKPPQPIAERDIVPLMNAGKYTFVIDIPPNFERDVLAGRQPGVQVNVDATAMVQAGLGSGYAQQIITTEIDNFVSSHRRRHAARVAGQPRGAHRLQPECRRPPGSPASWASSTTSPCWRSSWPARRWSASASTARWTICWSCR